MNLKWIFALFLGILIPADLRYGFSYSAPINIAALSTEMPDFNIYENHGAKKKAFLGYMHPVVMRVNAKVQRERSKLLTVYHNHINGGRVGALDRLWLRKLALDYRINNFNAHDAKQWDELVKRVDIVPASLALAQAAAESGWGTSRFAKDLNNFFGHCCRTPGCGTIPENWAQGKGNRMQRFASVDKAVETYIRNLNTHRAYRDMRLVRAQRRLEGKPIQASDLAKGLLKYSVMGHSYIRDIRTLIRQNQLEQYASLPHKA